MEKNKRKSVTGDRGRALEKAAPRFSLSIPVIPIALALVALKLCGVISIGWTAIGILLGILLLPLALGILIMGVFFIAAALTLLNTKP